MFSTSRTSHLCIILLEVGPPSFPFFTPERKHLLRIICDYCGLLMSCLDELLCSSYYPQLNSQRLILGPTVTWTLTLPFGASFMLWVFP